MTAAEWLDGIRQLRQQIEGLARQAAELADVPAAAAEDQLRQAWSLLAPGTACYSPSASSFAAEALAANWTRGVETAAAILRPAMQAISGRLQASAAAPRQLCPLSGFRHQLGGGRFGIAMIVGDGENAPRPASESAKGQICIGFDDALSPGHPLKQAIPDRESLFWDEEATATNRRFCWILGEMVPAPGPQIIAYPDYFDLRQAIDWTHAYACRKRIERARLLAEAERKRRRDEAEEKRLARQQHFARIGSMGGVDVMGGALEEIDQLRGKIAALENAKPATK